MESTAMPIKQSLGCLARKRIGQRLIFFSVLIPMFLATAACQPSASTKGSNDRAKQMKRANDASAIFQPQGSGKVTLRIVAEQNAPNENLQLYRIVGNSAIPIDLPDNQPSDQSDKVISNGVDSGFYMLRTIGTAAGEVKVPVPAIAPFVPVDGLTVQIGSVPEPEPGWCWIPAGPAIIGDTLGVGREDERPAKIVELPGFWMGEKEVTNQQYAAFLSSQKSIEENWIDLRSRKCLIVEESTETFVADSSAVDAVQKPVVMVSLAGALAYCQWRSSVSGHSIRLPTEQEWEKAARGPESFVYAYGNIYKQSRANQESGKLKPVGSYSPNSYGLYDMTGNVFEWMSNKADPTNDETPLNHSLRGGSFVLDGMYLRNSFRMRQSPTVMTDDIGFRVVRDAINKPAD